MIVQSQIAEDLLLIFSTLSPNVRQNITTWPFEKLTSHAGKLNKTANKIHKAASFLVVTIDILLINNQIVNTQFLPMPEEQ
jgi:hypothetical protein